MKTGDPRKIYSRDADGTPDLWFDPETMTLNDTATAVPVESEEEAARLAAENLEYQASVAVED